MHVIAAKAVALKEALTQSFVEYQTDVVKNARALAKHLLDGGIDLVSGGTDNHMMLLDLRSIDLTGKDAEDMLHAAGITANKNSVPFDTQSPNITSGLRIGTPAVTTRGMKEKEMALIGEYILETFKHRNDHQAIGKIREKVDSLCKSFPLYES